MKEDISKNKRIPSNIRFSFPKEERICSKIAFDYLFKKGQSFREDVLKCVYVFDLPSHLTSSNLSVAFSVPRRKFKNAVDRNYIKRRLKESFRLHKHELKAYVDDKDITLAFILIYTKTYKTNFKRIERSVIKVMEKLLTQE